MLRRTIYVLHSFSLKRGTRPVESDNYLYYVHFCSGGSEHPSSMLDLTRGHFNQSYTGCLRNIVVQNTLALDTDLSKSGVVGRSVGSCLEQPQTSSPT